MIMNSNTKMFASAVVLLGLLAGCDTKSTQPTQPTQPTQSTQSTLKSCLFTSESLILATEKNFNYEKDFGFIYIAFCFISYKYELPF